MWTVSPDTVFRHPDLGLPDTYKNCGSEILIAAAMKSTVFWKVTPCISGSVSNFSSKKLSVSILIETRIGYKKILCDKPYEVVLHET
jgi:hypothetical protein